MRLGTIVIVFFVGALAVVNAPPSWPEESQRTEKRVRDFISGGLNDLAAGDIDGAIKNYGDALAVGGEGAATTAQRAAAYSHRGQAFFILGNFARARDDFLQALDARAELSGYVNYFDKAADWGRLGDAYFGLGEYDRAIAEGYSAAMVELNDAVNSAEMRFKRAVARYNLGRFDQAIEDFTYVISLGTYYDNGTNSFDLTNPFEQSLLHRGRAYTRTGAFDLAHADLTALIERRSSPPSADINGYGDRATVLAATGSLELARQDLHAALKHDPRNVRHLAALRCLSAGPSCAELAPPQLIGPPAFRVSHPGQGPHNVAIDQFSFVLRRDPENFAALLGLGDTHLARDQFDRAIQYYDRALALNRDAVPGLLGRARAKTALQRLDDAIVDYSDALTAGPEDVALLGRILYERGLALRSAHQTTAARLNFAAAFAHDPDLVYAGYLAQSL